MTIRAWEHATDEEKTAVQHLCDAVNLHITAQGSEAYGKYVAIRLADGKSPDGALYDTRRDAARHNASDPWCFYLKVSPGGINKMEAWVVLGYARMAKKSGVKFAEEDPVVPQRLELGGSWTARQVAALAASTGRFSRG
jgi:hypothetical protein